MYSAGQSRRIVVQMQANANVAEMGKRYFYYLAEARDNSATMHCNTVSKRNAEPSMSREIDIVQLLNEGFVAVSNCKKCDAYAGRGSPWIRY